MKKGTQIAYIPSHAKGDIEHPDVEFGFVMSESRGSAYFCRYWLKGKPGDLRSVANSELTPSDCLVEHESVNQAFVDAYIQAIEEER